MKFIADLHIHSHYSVATSRNLTPEYLEYWARIKGINVVGTGDCIHPGWLRELKEKCEPAGNGLLKLKDEFRLRESKELKDASIPGEIYFILTGEISNIYKKNDRVRKVHNVCVFPDFDAVISLQSKLDAIGNITSDGRPILGLDSKILLEQTLESGEQSFLIPAHIWTPWFSVLGSKSGFDTIEECYEDLTGEIFAVETGLSTDPAMNWTCSFLDRFKLVSNSDAHSPEKLGREANLFDTDLSYRGIYKALKGDDGFDGTIEFFPQEGKYHYDGHRKCGIRWDPLETVKHGGRCPVCGKPVTRGVMYRIAELADRKDISLAPERRNFYSITQLPDLIAEIRGIKNFRARSVQREFFRIIHGLGDEFFVLLFADIDDIQKVSDEFISEGIRRLREGDVIIDEGYDGEFGRVHLFNEKELQEYSSGNLFNMSKDMSALSGPVEKKSRYETSVRFDIDEFKRLVNAPKEEVPCGEVRAGTTATYDFSEEQTAAITHGDGPALVIAGPGTGKTRVLTERIAWLIEEKKTPPESILAITFSNRAAGEMNQRVCQRIDPPWPEIKTFHAFGLGVLQHHYRHFNRDSSFMILDRDEARETLASLTEEKNRARREAEAIEKYKQGMLPEEEKPALFDDYNAKLIETNAFDINDLVYLPVLILEAEEDLRTLYRETYRHILIDEYQDINPIQFRLIDALTAENPSLFLIGDPAQAIYGFRGSDLNFMTNARENFPAITEYTLSKSYRCPGAILEAGQQVLHADRVLGGTEKNIQVSINEMVTDRSEAEWIASTIEDMMGGLRSFSMESGKSDGYAAHEDISFGDFAILCRASFMFEPLLEAMANHAIPCQVVGNAPFVNESPYREAITTFRDIFYRRKSDALDEESARVARMIEEEYSIEEILDEIMDSLGAEDEERKRLINFTSTIKDDYSEFLRRIPLGAGTDDFVPEADAVSLMTIHASKGLEFRHVFIPGCEETIIPFELFGSISKEERAEEERLLYVGMTRTEDTLFLSHAGKRNWRNRTLVQKRSPFLSRIEKRLCSFHEQERRHRDEEEQLQLFS